MRRRRRRRDDGGRQSGRSVLEEAAAAAAAGVVAVAAAFSFLFDVDVHGGGDDNVVDFFVGLTPVGARLPPPSRPCPWADWAPAAWARPPPSFQG